MIKDQLNENLPKAWAKLVSIILCLVLSSSAYAQKPIKTSNPNDEWEIKWSASDEFNGATPDWSKWIRTGNLPNTTAWKWDNAQNVQINNGAAELTMRQNPNNASDGGTYFKSGILKSYQTFTYGYYEAKIKGADIGEGVCPSFWLYSNFDYSVGNGKTVYSEIDVVELQQFDWYEGHQDDIRDMDHNLHAVVKVGNEGVWRRPKAYPDEQLNKYRAPWDPTEDYHIYGCEVNETEIIWYVDGIEVGRKPNTYWYRPMNVTLSLGLRKPFVEFYNNRNNAVNPETDADAKAQLPGMPTTMYVDYVRVWEKSGTNNNPVLGVGDIGNPGFEEGSLNYWNAGSGLSSIVQSNVSNGNYAAQVTNGNVAQIITLKANTTYTISVDGKVLSQGGKAYFGLNEAVSNTLVKNYEFNSTNYTNGSITVNTGATEATYRLWFWSANDAVCDNFEIVEGEGEETPDVGVTGVNLSTNQVSLNKGETQSITANVVPSNATNKGVTWSSSNNNVATVSNGVITAVNEGTTTIKVTTVDGSFEDQATVTVLINDNLLDNPGFELSDESDWNLEGGGAIVNNNSRNGSKAGYINGNGSINQVVSLAANTTYTLTAWGKVQSQGQSVYLGVTNATTNTFIENALFTSISYNQLSITFTTSSSVNDYRIWFWNNQGGQYYIDDLKLTEEGSNTTTPVTSVSLNTNNLNLNAGENVTLTANVLPSNATNKSVSWSCDNNSIATVNNGVVTAVAAGSTTVRVTTNDGSYTASCSVTVTEDNNGGVTDVPTAGSTIWLSTVDGTYITVNAGSGTALQATKSSVSSNEEYLVVDADGYFALQSIGTGKYVTVASGTNDPIKCGATGIFDRQKFTFEVSDNYLLIKGKVNGKYLVVDESLNNNPLFASTSNSQNATKFNWDDTSSSNRVTSVIDESSSIKVYPNPVRGEDLNVALPSSEEGMVQLYDLHGQLVLEKSFSNKSQVKIESFHTMHLKGVYLLHVTTTNYLFNSKVLIE
ncbi:Ig-like domain-containing protein [Flammeovirga agarivorans]|uniref:Family 16 glycosylhydrolase n=1 Tax=Flammeovirga agarivorans TaxID=2726742 RepID=A0A7X8SK11_9BACT|nr:Ig-like domain-containing protein [Flammeovirga agarivorans]NLR91552.1 family 16 glycosylhydrolase [Flammeovirga agarivorans]